MPAVPGCGGLTTPDRSAQNIAGNAVPKIDNALRITNLYGDVYPGDLVNGQGMIHIVFRSSEAYDFARWVRRHATQDEAARGHQDAAKS